MVDGKQSINSLNYIHNMQACCFLLSTLLNIRLLLQYFSLEVFGIEFIPFFKGYSLHHECQLIEQQQTALWCE
jgi:hypothetical protein